MHLIITVNDVFWHDDGTKECYGGFDISVEDLNGELVVEYLEEESFMFSGYHKRVHMGNMSEVVNDICESVGDPTDEFILDLKTKIKTATTNTAMGEWYTEPDYVNGWDDIDIEHEM
jgi:hypothetical protein